MIQKPSIIILRGLPGSGKSELAVLLSENGKYPYYSVDDYFTNNQNGIYHFDYTKNHIAYRECIEKTRKSALEGVPKIIVHNTFTMDWELEPYFKLAAELSFRIYVVTVENRHGNINSHGITDEQMKKMAEKYRVILM